MVFSQNEDAWERLSREAVAAALLFVPAGAADSSSLSATGRTSCPPMRQSTSS